VLIRTLVYYVTRHMQHKLAPVLFKDDDLAAAKAARPSPVAPAQRSPAALAKAATKATTDGGPVHSFATLLEDLATIAVNRIQPAGGLPAFTVITTSTQSSARPSISSAFPAALGTRSQAASDHRAFSQADALPRSTQGNIGRAIAWPT
jgi:hypothetical protein